MICLYFDMMDILSAFLAIVTSIILDNIVLDVHIVLEVSVLHWECPCCAAALGVSVLHWECPASYENLC